jgi:hypothetical protein
MLNLSSSLKEELAKNNTIYFWLIQIGPLYATDSPERITYEGNEYVPYPLDINGFKQADGSPLDGGTIRLGNVTQELAASVLSNSLADAVVYIKCAFFDAHMNSKGHVLVASGRVDGRPSLDEEWASLSIEPHLNPWTISSPRRRITKSIFPTLPIRGTKITWGTSIMVIK